MNIHFIYQVAKREVQRLLNRKALFLFILLAPASSFYLIEYLFSAGVIREIPVTVVDLDQSNLSRLLAKNIDASPLVKIVDYSPDAKNAKDKIFKGHIHGAIIFPKNLEKNVMRTNPAEVDLFYNNSNLVLGGNLRSGIYKVIATINAQIKVKSYLREGMYFSQAVDKANPVGLDIHQLFNPYSNYAYFLVIGLLPVMLIVFTFLISLYALGSELKEATAGDLMKTANNSLINALSGKFLPYTLLFVVDALIMDVVIFDILGAPFQGSLWIILLSELLLIMAYQSLSILFLAVTNNMRLSLSLGSAYTLLSFTFSGLTFPLLAMPLIAKIFAWFFPYTFWIRIFLAESLRGEPIHNLQVEFYMLVGFFVIGILAFPSIKRRLNDPSKWGKS